MSESLIGTILSAVIAGIFRLISKRMELNQSRPQTTVEKPVEGAETAHDVTDSQSMIFWHIGLIQFLVNLSGFLVSQSYGMTMEAMSTQLIIGSIVAIGGFCWAGLQVPRKQRWNHLILVALGVFVTTLFLNSLVFGWYFVSSGVGFAIAQTLITMIIGGSIANSIKS